MPDSALSQASRPQAILFDWAGTTIDFGSRGPLAVFLEVFRRRDVPISVEEARAPMGRAKREHIASILLSPAVAARWTTVHGREPTTADVDSIYQEFLPLQKSILASYCDLIPGVAEVVRGCRERGLRIGSTTGYTRELMDIVTPLAAEQGYQPDVVITADDASEGRPAPWANFRACEALKVFPMRRVIVIDDTVVGIAAGRNAGAWTIGVTDSSNELGLSREEYERLDPETLIRARCEIQAKFLRHGANFTINTVADLLPILDIISDRLASGEIP